MNSMNAQHLNVKIFLNNKDLKLASVVLAFHRWIQDSAAEELLIDIADYKHVPCGPGIILIGHQANYSLDFGPENMPGLLYSAKVQRDDTEEEKIAHALRQAFKGCLRLENDEALGEKLIFSGREIRLTFNDRLNAPNTDECFKAVEPAVRKVFSSLYGPASFEIKKISTDPRERLTLKVASSAEKRIETLLQSLN